MPPSNDLLAEVYYERISQTVIVWPLVWWHERNGGDWEMIKNLETDE